MFGRLRYYWGIGWHYLRLAIQAQMEYPAFLAGWLITNPMQVLVGVLTIYFTVQNFGSLGGWSFAELAFLLGILPLAISTGAGAGGQNAIGTGVMGGTFAATVLGIFFVPVFFVLVFRLFNRKAREGRGTAVPKEKR